MGERDEIVNHMIKQMHQTTTKKNTRVNGSHFQPQFIWVGKCNPLGIMPEIKIWPLLINGRCTNQNLSLENEDT